MWFCVARVLVVPRISFVVVGLFCFRVQDSVSREFTGFSVFELFPPEGVMCLFDRVCGV